MKVCGACCEELPKESFSKKQWQLKQHQRRCKECVDAKKELQLKPPPKNKYSWGKSSGPVADEDACCWICLCDGPDELGQPLRRDCSCRGTDAGFAHVSCIVSYGTQKSLQLNSQGQLKRRTREYDSNLNKFRQPWEQCVNCKQNHQNELAVDLASQFITFVEKTYPNDLPIHLEALVLKLEAIQGMLARLDANQKGNAKKLCNRALIMIGQLELACYALPKRIILAEAVIYSILGRLLLSDRTNESSQDAIVAFEKCRDANKRIDNPNGIALADSYIAIAKSRCDGGEVDVDAMVEKIRPVYEQRVEKLGADAPMTIAAGLDLARSLEKANKMLEAERLLQRLAKASRRVQGPDHAMTKKAEAHLELWKARYVSVMFSHQWFLFETLRYEDDYKKMVVQGPVETSADRNKKKEEVMTVDTVDTRPSIDTIVVCFGLDGEQDHLNGKIGMLESRDDVMGLYKIIFDDDKLDPCFVKHEHLRVLFELPEEQQQS